MLKPDKYFNQYDFYFEKVHWSEARKLFRRAIRQYYAMQRRLFFDPSTELLVKKKTPDRRIHRKTEASTPYC